MMKDTGIAGKKNPDLDDSIPDMTDIAVLGPHGVKYTVRHITIVSVNLFSQKAVLSCIRITRTKVSTGFFRIKMDIRDLLRSMVSGKN